MAVIAKAFLICMILAVVVTQATARDEWYRRYYDKRLPGGDENSEEHDNIPLKGNLVVFNPWISPLVRKYRLIRLNRRSSPLFDGF
uniref:Neuropeptide-Like Protein n=1 Tax=Syphacia muris TaxID=451379 RepID=A0A0N5AK30_9BILA